MKITSRHLISVLLFTGLILMIVPAIYLWQTQRQPENQVASTGAEIVALTEKDATEVEQIRALKKLVPFKTPDFSVDFSHKYNKFTVFFYKETGKQQLDEWLKNNGFYSIPEDRFVLVQTDIK